MYSLVYSQNASQRAFRIFPMRLYCPSVIKSSPRISTFVNNKHQFLVIEISNVKTLIHKLHMAASVDEYTQPYKMFINSPGLQQFSVHVILSNRIQWPPSCWMVRTVSYSSELAYTIFRHCCFTPMTQFMPFAPNLVGCFHNLLFSKIEVDSTIIGYPEHQFIAMCIDPGTLINFEFMFRYILRSSCQTEHPFLLYIATLML